MIWKSPNPFDYPDSLPAEDPLWKLLYSMFRTGDQRPTMAHVSEEVGPPFLISGSYYAYYLCFSWKEG